MPNQPLPPQSEKQVLAVASHFAGPLPPPEVLRQYEAVSPGLAMRIVEMAEQEGAHRREMENRSLQGEFEAMRRDFREARWGQIFAFVIALAFMVAGSYVSIKGQPWSGTILGSVGLWRNRDCVYLGKNTPCFVGS